MRHRESLPNIAQPAPVREPALDGLRAIAVGLVILFLYWPNQFSGGFAGVDIFFVLSGFLITGILLRQMDRGGIAFSSFYLRRTARLCPALFVMVAVVAFVAIACAVTPAGEVLRDAGWVLSYTSNWKRAFIEHFGDSRYFNHTWSLGIEEQFYLTWPLFLACLTPYVSRRALLATVAGLIALMTFWRIYLLYSGASGYRLHHAFDTRADTLLFGCALAIGLSLPSWREQLSSVAARFSHLPILALALIVVIGALCPFESSALPCVGLTLIGLLAALALAALHLNPLSPSSRLLAAKPVAYIGIISYGIYLWHVPVH
jgi:peptidoglycan/LPS O-acetylase OafA/YrhL